MHAHGEPGRTRRSLALAALGMVLVLAACTGDDDDAAGETTTTSTTTTTTSTTTTTTTEPPDPTEDAVAVWEQAWSVAGEKDSTVETLADLTTPEVADRLIATLHLGQEESPESFPGRTVTNHPTIEENDDGTFTIQDCLLIRPSVTADEANWYSGTITEQDGTLRVTRLEPEVVTGCVPAPVAENIYAVFNRYWELGEEGVRPGNAEFEGMITGEHRETILPKLADREAQGGVLREFDEQHPEIIEYRTGFARISSCTAASPETGAYSIETGERLDADVPASHDGRNLYELHFTLEDGSWKVSKVIGDKPAQCQPAPTPLAIAEV